MGKTEQLSELAKQYMGAHGQKLISEYILDGDITSGQIYSLGYIDSLFVGGELLEEEAKKAYILIGIDPEKASAIRQRNNKF